MVRTLRIDGYPIQLEVEGHARLIFLTNELQVSQTSPNGFFCEGLLLKQQFCLESVQTRFPQALAPPQVRICNLYIH
ncbi:hypothetical protein D3C71_1039830 [compost metagenome]